MPPTRGGRGDGGVNAAAARATRLGKDEGTKTTEIETLTLPRRSVTLPVGADAERALGATFRWIARVDGWGESPAATRASPIAVKPPA